MEKAVCNMGKAVAKMADAVVAMQAVVQKEAAHGAGWKGEDTGETARVDSDATYKTTTDAQRIAAALLQAHADDGGQHGGCAAVLLSVGPPPLRREDTWPAGVYCMYGDEHLLGGMLRSLWFAKGAARVAGVAGVAYEVLMCIGEQPSASARAAGPRPWDMPAYLNTLKPISGDASDLYAAYLALHGIAYVPYRKLRCVLNDATSL